MDVALDPVGGETLRRSYGVLRPGWLVALQENPDQQQLEAHQIHGSYFLVEPSRDELTQIAALVDDGRLRAIVSHVFPLTQASEAYEQALAGHNRGKTVLTAPLIHCAKPPVVPRRGFRPLLWSWLMMRTSTWGAGVSQAPAWRPAPA